MNNQNLIDLKNLLERASSEDRSNLQRIIGAGFGNSPDLLCDHFHFLRSGVFGQKFSARSYKQLATDVADHIHIDWDALLRGREWRLLPTSEIEDAIVITTLQGVLKKLPDVQRRRLAEELGKESKDPNLVGELLSGGAIALARLSGFQIYLFATSAVGALTGALGIVLPFAFYTAITGGLSIVLGPIGWAVLGVFALFNLNQANWSRLLPGIIYVSYIRHKLEADIGQVITYGS
jgi:uncharacterized protein YaaW (UPF0174 family)